MTRATSKLFPRILLLTVLPGVLTCFSVAFLAAQISSSAHKLVGITVTGTKLFEAKDVIAESGLQTGVTATEDDFKKAARNLGETGAFSDVAYRYSFSSEGTKLELEVTDADKFLPARFEDFVWFSDEELRRAIKEHVPLWIGQLPISGRLPNEVSDALQAVLVQHGIAGQVEYIMGAAQGQVNAFEFSVANVLIQVRNIEFTGVGASELQPLQAAAAKLPDREYSRSRLTIFAEKQLLPVFHSRGYLKASFGLPEPTVVKVPEAEADENRNQTFVDVTFAVTQGRQYKLSRLSWSGNKALPNDALQALIYAPIGQPVNTVKLGDGMHEIQTLYGSKGYVSTTVKADAEFDDTANTAALVLKVTEGDLYHMGDLEFRGIDNGLTAKLRALWKIRQGDVYDSTYLQQYLPQAQKLLPPSLDWDVASHVTANVRDKSVDVDLVYSAKAPK